MEKKGKWGSKHATGAGILLDKVRGAKEKALDTGFLRKQKIERPVS